MYLTVHGTAGILLARAIPNPLLAFVAGLISHFVLDLVPHGDEHLIKHHFTRQRTLRRLLGASLLDGCILASLTSLYLWTTPWANTATAIWGLIGALLPDLLQGLYFVTQTKLLRGFNRLHVAVHNLPNFRFTWQTGALLQCLTLTALWLLLI